MLNLQFLADCGNGSAYAVGCVYVCLCMTVYCG